MLVVIRLVGIEFVAVVCPPVVVDSGVISGCATSGCSIDGRPESIEMVCPVNIFTECDGYSYRDPVCSVDEAICGP